MTDNKLHTLLQKVLQATKENKIDWEKNPKDESSFKADLGGNTLYIVRLGTSTLNESKVFVIINDSGDEIGRYKAPYSWELNELYDLAKNKALKIKESLDDIDDILDSML